MIFNFCFSSNSPVAFGSGLFSKRVKTETSNLRVIKNPKHMKNKIEPVTQYCLRHGVGTTNVAHLWSSFKYDKQINVCKNERPNFKNLTDLNGSVHWRVKDKNVFKKIIIKIKKYLIESKGNMYFSRGDTDKELRIPTYVEKIKEK